MTENEKRIVTLLYKEGPLSKPEICRMGQMGWATAVKFISRLKDAGVIESTIRKAPGQGKNPEVHGLTDRTPVGIGMDVEFQETNVILLNLRGEVLAGRTCATPSHPDEKLLREFLSHTLSDFVQEHVSGDTKPVGIGIGLPGIGMSSWVRHNKDHSTDLSTYLEAKLGIRVETDINVRAYSIYEKWARRTFDANDVMFLTIRTGIGSGIFLNHSLLLGHQEHAGEIGHMTVRPDGSACVCGRRGCLQTVVNQNQLFREYRSGVLGKRDSADAVPSHEDLLTGLADLFSRAKSGESPAGAIVGTAGRYLGECLADCVMILNVPQIVLSGHFGDDGDVILGYVKEEVQKRILQRMEVALEYHPLDDNGFTMGAALLILRDYYTGIPNPGA